ncbi:hypothetical protein N7471_010612 [Penicillium samsonianum]|uniref:uncharacterized protein n=1 Tax=Penicillium samsonianum TaxID=1882272 RepID=UPI002546CABA|nr:uncharacterized protein N7471_010612 [Penicillium samsonianum]KAJ6126119.1 hypothetical protein N7471_010612 [Penicillium samsonianum]
MRSQRVGAVARQQLLFNFLPPHALALVWASILETIESAGLQQFSGVTILVQGKNLKTLTKAHMWDGMTQEFAQHWGTTIDESYLSDQFYIDIGKETCPTGPSRCHRPSSGGDAAFNLMLIRVCGGYEVRRADGGCGGRTEDAEGGRRMRRQ